MNAKIDQLVQSFLQKNTLAECSVSELQNLAEQYPYSSAMQLLFTAKLKTTDSDKYKLQLQKTSLFFNNPLWLQHLLSEAGNSASVNAERPSTTKTEPAGIIKEEETHLVELPSLKLEKPEPAKDELTFEPYHTIDYFASQGVKFKVEEKPQDKFGQQLKSFTEWLKLLRQVPASELDKTVDTNQEQKVEQLAAHSIEDRDVVTEAMAAVWEKQGNKEKAIEIYNKLGLLNPSKNSYFAAKIEQLKNLT
jgi:hypothetical protein